MYEYESDAAGDMVLKGAQDLIRTYGWVQGKTGSRDVGYCISGALNVAMWKYDRQVWEEVYSRVRRLVKGEGSNGLASYNDASRRTEQEVLDLLERARIEQETGNV